MQTMRTLNRRHFLKLGLVPLAAAATAACAGFPAGWFDSARDDTASRGESIEHPEGADELVLRMEVTGGFVPVEYLLTYFPHLSIYGEGSVITEGPQIAIYPPPALPSLVYARISEEGIQLILQEAKSAGLIDGDASYDDLTSFIADAGTTVFTTNAGGRTSIVSAYALSIGGNLDMIESENREAWVKLVDFEEKMLTLIAWLPQEIVIESETPYEFDRIAVIIQPINSSMSSQSDDGGEMDWPLADPLAGIGDQYPSYDQNLRCFVAEGSTLETLMPAFQQANTLTRWQSDGSEYFLYLRPLLPDEDGC